MSCELIYITRSVYNVYIVNPKKSNRSKSMWSYFLPKASTWEFKKKNSFKWKCVSKNKVQQSFHILRWWQYEVVWQTITVIVHFAWQINGMDRFGMPFKLCGSSKIDRCNVVHFVSAIWTMVVGSQLASHVHTNSLKSHGKPLIKLNHNHIASLVTKMLGYCCQYN